LDGTLLYATGGLAALSANFEADGDSHDETFIGWTAGGGIEHMVSESISIKAEALFADFGSKNFSLAGDDTDIDANMVVVRAGITFRF
jgi:outer membrane immunogenic protein